MPTFIVHHPAGASAVTEPGLRQLARRIVLDADRLPLPELLAAINRRARWQAA
jgi:hypothetical protein